MIEARGVTKLYRKKVALENINFRVNNGEIFGIIGPNGAGKSTLISIISTAIRPDNGDVLIDGRSVISQAAHVRKIIGYVPQDIALHSELSVLDNLKFWAHVNSSSIKNIGFGEIEHLAKALELENVLKVRVENLSGGMKRRVNIAVALLNSPDVIIMDEPTVGLDIVSRKVVIKLIKDLAATGKTIVYTSHNYEEIEHLCNRILVLNEGKKIFEGLLTDARNQIPDDSILGYLGSLGL
jgi:ABC-2 type transport system ATP-binding protein